MPLQSRQHPVLKLLVSDFILQILKELKPLVWIFLSQNIPEVANLIYLLYMVTRQVFVDLK